MIGIIRYGAGNIFLLLLLWSDWGLPMAWSILKPILNSIDRYIIPGVGHAGAAMHKLEKTGLVPAIKTLNKPTLGICVGMQLLTSYSEEGDADLLGIYSL
jgi:glutamine amidotransferase